MHISYAQRLEDYHLEQVFAGEPPGFYIDVGAGHPIADNVSYWFYLKGWRGLVIEPQRALCGLYAHLRPRDIAVETLVGRSEGEAEFHIVEGMHGLSTAVAAHTRAALALGATVKPVLMPMTTLAALTAAHKVGTVDFLKIDVEGAEADVLAGADWQRCRPRVVLVEALAPGSLEESWSAWEPTLTAAGYRFAFFDGLNRFYVAEEAHELAARFPREPAPWDRVQHLYDFGHADKRADHPDHALAKALVEGFLAALPRLDPALVRELLMGAALSRAVPPSSAELARLLFGTAEFPGPSASPALPTDPAALCETVMSSDRFRAALGRIACTYDGGHIME
jgi:FkbM family methyltransferase